MKTRFKYLHFEKHKIRDDLWICKNNRVGYNLGWCEYKKKWKMWMFQPAPFIEYSVD